MSEETCRKLLELTDRDNTNGRIRRSYSAPLVLLCSRLLLVGVPWQILGLKS
jgi:hypothetical protein